MDVPGDTAVEEFVMRNDTARLGILEAATREVTSSAAPILATHAAVFTSDFDESGECAACEARACYRRAQPPPHSFTLAWLPNVMPEAETIFAAVVAPELPCVPAVVPCAPHSAEDARRTSALLLASVA
jgi:hypothetical protein